MPLTAEADGEGEHHDVAHATEPRRMPTTAARIQPAQHVTEVWGHPAWTIIGPDSSNAIPPNAAASGPNRSTRHNTYAPVPAMMSLVSTAAVYAKLTGTIYPTKRGR